MLLARNALRSRSHRNSGLHLSLSITESNGLASGGNTLASRSSWHVIESRIRMLNALHEMIVATPALDWALALATIAASFWGLPRAYRWIVSRRAGEE